MFPDHYDTEPFNPFNVGPANSGVRSEFKIPTSVTYPPPVFVAKPEYVKAAEELTAQRSVSHGTVKLPESKLGEVALSKAIKEEMAVAKQQAAALHETDRIDAGAGARVTIFQDPHPKEAESKASMRTLLPVRSNREESGQGIAKEAASGASVASKHWKSLRTASKISNRISSKSSLKPFEPAKMSLTAVPSKLSEISAQSSVQSDAKSSSSEETVKPADSDADSQHSLKSEKSALKETASLKSKTTVKESRNTLVSETSLSYGQSLTEQAADLANRLNSGNENFRRYNSVERNHSTTIPQKQSQGDRMTFWFSDAVLS